MAKQLSNKQQAVVAARSIWREKIKHAHHLSGPFKLLPETVNKDNLDIYAAEFNRVRSLLAKALRGA